MEHKVIIHDTVYTNDAFFDIPIDITKQVSIGASVSERYAEELDIGQMIISYSRREKEYDMFALIEIIIYKNEEEIKRYDLFVEEDSVEPLNKKGDRYFKHTLRLIELTHMLDQSLINTLNFTQPLMGRYLPPFEQDFEIEITPGDWQSLDPDKTVNSDVLTTLTRYTCILDKPEIYNRYDGKVRIPKMNQMIFQFASQSTDYFDENYQNVLLYVYKIIEDAFGEYEEEFLPEYSHILSDEDFEEDLPTGRYRIKIGGVGVVNALVDPEKDPDTDYPVRRFLSFYVGVDRPRYTMLDIVNRIRNTSPLEKQSMLSTTRKFEINSELADRLEKITAPQMLLKELTTREGLNEALKYVNSVCRLVRDDNIFKIVENHFNTRNNEYEKGDIFSYSSEKNTMEYSTSLRSYLKRTISNNSNDTPSIKTPSAKDYEGYRSETLQILPNTTKIFLSEPVYRMVKATARLYYEIPMWGTQSRIVKDLEIDLTPRVLEEKEFKLRRSQIFVTGSQVKLIAGNPRGDFLRATQGEFARYKYMGKEIDFTEPFQGVEGFFAEPYYTYVLHSALYENMVFMLGRNTSEFGIEPLPGDEDKPFRYTYSGLKDGHSQSGLYPEDESTTFWGFLSGETDIYKTAHVEVKFEYITMSDTIHNSQRENTETIFKDTVKKINQNSRITNYEQASKQSYGLAQRYGVPTINFAKLTKYPEHLPNPGDFNEKNELIVEKETVFHKNHVLGKFEASRDFNRFSKFIGIDKEYRYSEIPNPNVSEDRVELYEEFLEYYTGSAPTTVDNNTYINNLFMETMFNTITQEENKNDIGISNALIRTDGTKENYPDKMYAKKFITIPTISMGGKNVLSFGFHFKDSRIAGDIVDFNDIFDILEEPTPYGMWQEFVEYTKQDGTFDVLEFKLANAIPNEQEDSSYHRTRKLPLVNYNPSTALYQMEDITFASTDNSGEEDPLMIFKDQGERFGLVYQISFVPRDKEAREDIIFGTNFTTFNYLVNGKQEDKFLYTYNNGTKYFKFDDQKIKSGFNNKTALVSPSDLFGMVYSNEGLAIGIEFAEGLLPSGTTSWAIGNDNGDLDIANNTPNNNVIFIPRNKRRDVKYNLFEYLPYDIHGTSLDTVVMITATIEYQIPEIHNAEITVNLPITNEVEIGQTGEITEQAISVGFQLTSNAVGYTDEITEQAISVSFFLTNDIVGYGNETINEEISSLFTVGSGGNTGLEYIAEETDEIINVLFNGSYSSEGFANEPTNQEITVNFLASHEVVGYGNEATNQNISSLFTVGSASITGTEYVAEETDEIINVLFNVSSPTDGVGNETTNEALSVTFDLNENSSGEEYIAEETNEIITATFSLNVNGDGYLDYNMEWTSGGTSPSGQDKCSDYDDKDNVRCDIVGYEKEWQTTGVSGSGEPEGTYYTSLPSTDNFEEGDKIKLYNSFIDAWQEYELVLVPVYGNCEICSIVT